MYGSANRMSDCRAFRQALSLIKVQTNNTPDAKDTRGSKAQHQPPLFYSITHLVPRHIKALNSPNKLSHDIYLGLMDKKNVQCVRMCESVRMCVCCTVIMKR